MERRANDRYVGGVPETGLALTPPRAGILEVPAVVFDDIRLERHVILVERGAVLELALDQVAGQAVELGIAARSRDPAFVHPAVLLDRIFAADGVVPARLEQEYAIVGQVARLDPPADPPGTGIAAVAAGAIARSRARCGALSRSHADIGHRRRRDRLRRRRQHRLGRHHFGCGRADVRGRRGALAPRAVPG